MAVIVLKMDLCRVLIGTYTFDSPYILLTVLLCLPETTLHQIQLLINTLIKKYTHFRTEMKLQVFRKDVCTQIQHFLLYYFVFNHVLGRRNWFFLTCQQQHGKHHSFQGRHNLDIFKNASLSQRNNHALSTEQILQSKHHRLFLDKITSCVLLGSRSLLRKLTI